MRVLFAFASVLLLAALPASAQWLEESPEAFRAELISYVAGLKRLNPSLLSSLRVHESLPMAEQEILALSNDELLELRTALAKVPYWRELPDILEMATMQMGVPAAPSPREMASLLSNSVSGPQMSMLRQEMIQFIQILKGVAPEVVSAGYHERLASMEKKINALGQEDVIALHVEIQNRLPAWQAAVTMEPGAAKLQIAPLADCSGGGLGEILCEFGNIFAEIAAIPGKVAQFASDAANAVKNGLLSLFSALKNALPSLQTLVSNIFGNINWQQVANTVGQHLRLPCPQDFTEDFNLPLYGRVGDLSTHLHFAGTIGFLGNVAAEVTPGDILTGANLQMIFQVINFPIQWLSTCLEKAYDDEYKEAQGDHRDLVALNLDLDIQTLATEASLTEARVFVNQTLTTHVANVEKEVDALEAKMDRLGATQTKNTDGLREFQAFFLRIRIEADLQRNPFNKRISLFQLPRSVGGYLEEARAVVETTLQNRQAAKVNIKSASDYLSKAIAEQNRNNYKKAYTYLRKAYQKAMSRSGNADDNDND